MGYTQNLEDSLYEYMGGSDEDFTSDDVVDFINNPDTFRDFGEGLKLLTRKYMPASCNETEENFLKNKAAEAGIELTRNTVKNWYKGTRPKKGEQSREHMYKIGFALGMNIDDTVYLFKNIYLDKPFNMRSYVEFIYFYCINNGYDYKHARALIEAVEPESLRKEKDLTVYTEIITNTAKVLSSDDEVLEFIFSHRHNFQINNRSAERVLNSLLSEIRATKEEEIDWKNNRVKDSDTDKSYVIREIAHTRYKDGRDNSILAKYKSISSVETMLDVITGNMRGDSTTESGKSIFKNANLPKEITNRFPMKKSFSAKIENLSSEEIRKMIILLFSYKYWFEMQYLNKETDLDDYQMTLDEKLISCSLQTLYYGNPFDWLFLFCTLHDAPLDCFRDILYECGGAW